MVIQKERLRVALDLRPGEGSLVGLLLLHSLLQGVALAYLFTAANALFLERLDAHGITSLAFVYVAAGLLSAALTMIYAKLEHRMSFERLLQWSAIVLVPVVLLLRALLEVTDPFIIAFLLLVWYHVMHYLIDSRFWELSAVLFDVRESKRLFGMVSLGESVAKVFGYLSVPLLVHVAGTENLLLFAAGALVLSLPALRRMLDRYGDRLASLGRAAHGEASAHGATTAHGANSAHRATTAPDANSANGATTAHGANSANDATTAHGANSANGTTTHAAASPHGTASGHDSSSWYGALSAGLAKMQVPRLADRRYFVLLLLFTLFSFSALVFLEFGFLSTVQRRFVNDGEIAPFLGVFFGVGKALNILSRAFFSGRFIRRYGLLVGLAMLPVILLVLTIAIIAVPLLSSSERLPLLLFGLTVLFSEILRGPVANTAYLILFQPLPPKRRLDAHMLAKAKGEPAALVVSGLILVGVTLVSGALLYVSIGLALLMLGWIVVSVLLDREYGSVVRDSLRKRVLRGGSLELADPTTMAILESRIASQDPAEAIYALSLLAQAGHERLEEFVLELAQHASPLVRLDALRRIDELRLASASDVLEMMIATEPEDRLRGYAVTVYCVVAGERAIDVAAELLDDPTPDVAAGAMIGLLRSGGLQAVIIAGERLMAMTDSPDPEVRVQAARVIGEVGNAGFYHPLLPLFGDDDRLVSEAAIRAAGAVGNPALIQPLVTALSDARAPEAAAAALIRSGPIALPALRKAFDASDDSRVLRRICRIAERIGGDGALAILTDAIVHPRRDVRDQAVTLIALGTMSPSIDDAALVTDAVRDEIADAVSLLMLMQRISEAYGSAARSVVGALGYELERLRGRVLLLLSLAFDRRSLLRSRDRIGSQDPALRANALEILEISLPRGLVDKIMPLFEERDPELQYAAITTVIPHDALSPSACLEAIIARPSGRHSAWTRACSLRLADATGSIDLGTHLPSLLASRERIVRETAAEIVHAAEIAGARKVLRMREMRRATETLHEAGAEPLPGDVEVPDSDEVIASEETIGINDVQTRTIMISTIEKVMTLKLTDMFSETPEEILTDVAEAMQELFVPAGEEIIRKGEQGNCMYIIHEGSVRVHDGEHEFGRFGARDHFGELSLLDPEPRSASVTTVEDSHLLRLDQEALYEIMADSIEVARGILRNLTKRLRAQNALIVRLESGKEA